MARHICFLIHGIGKHDAQWAEAPGGPIETFKTVSREYAYFQDHDLEEKVEFVPVHYDEVFEEAVARWQGNATSLQGMGLGGPAEGLLSWLPMTDAVAQEFWWTHLADLALYRLTRIYRQQVRARVLDQIAVRIEAEAAPPSARCSRTAWARPWPTTACTCSARSVGAATPTP